MRASGASNTEPQRTPGRAIGTGRPQLVFVTQTVNPQDPLLGVAVDLIRALGGLCELSVIANEVRSVPDDIPASVLSLGKEMGASRSLRGLRYLRAIEVATRRGPPGQIPAIFVHMCPVYLNLAAPVAKARGARLLLWYAHAVGDASLSLAERLADSVLTSVPGAYPGRGAAVEAIGQAIDVARFSYTPVARAGPLRLLALGRTSATKRYHVAIRALRQALGAGVDAELRIVGPSATPAERAVRAELARLIGELDLQDSVSLEPGIPRSDVPEALRGCHAVVSTTVDGSADKAVFESMAAGRPVLLSNPALASLTDGWPLHLRFDSESASGLAARILELDRADLSLINHVGRGLRERITAEHGLDRWAHRVASIVAQAPGQGIGRALPAAD